MNGRNVTVVIDPMGNPKIEANGFNGVGCTDATKAIETALAAGSGGVERVFKPEWNNADVDNQQEQHVQW